MNKTIISTIKVIAIPLIYALALRLFFGVNTWQELYSVMSVSFLFCLPTIVGILTVYFSEIKNAQNIWYKICAPWIPIFLFFLITLALSIEGWACWLMILPLFMVAASVGGFIGGYLKVRKQNQNFNISILMLLPLFAAPIENMIGTIPGTFEAYTHIDICASDTEIWKNVTSVYEIPKQDDKGKLTQFLGFPRPLKAELNYNGVGAHREAIFTNGLTFHETVLQYSEKQKMVFTIKAYAHEIPSTTMDEHIVIGGSYFDVLNGTYELQKINATTYRLKLYSHFKLTTHFNFYASWWARWIMQDIQNNILQIIKIRAETKTLSNS